jgi:hypothetical protein
MCSVTAVSVQPAETGDPLIGWRVPPSFEINLPAKYKGQNDVSPEFLKMVFWDRMPYTLKKKGTNIFEAPAAPICRVEVSAK